MRSPSRADWPCSVERVTDLIGDAWTPLLLRDAFHGLRRYDDFHRSLGIARNTLSERLRRLVDAGVLHTRLYQDNPPRKEYLLTERGRELFAVLCTMLAWGDRWLDGGAGPPVVLHHDCGHDTHPRTVCARCHRPLDPDDVEFRRGPGFPADLADRPDIRRRFGPVGPSPRTANPPPTGR